MGNRDSQCSLRYAHKSTQEILRSGLKECPRCHRVLPATQEHFEKETRTHSGISKHCRICEQSLAIERRNKRGRLKVECNICGKKRLIWQNSRDVCLSCAMIVASRLNLSKSIKGLLKSGLCECNLCHRILPISQQYFKVSARAKTGLYLGRCRQCSNKVNNEKQESNLQAKLNKRISKAIHHSIRDPKYKFHWEEFVGYDLHKLKKHLEQQFVKGMSWDNYGEWHIDHVIPIVAFHFNSPDDIDFKRCWSLNNLQPLWKHDNLTKSFKIIKPFQPSLGLSDGRVWSESI